MFPDFIGIGAQKAGTTWLHRNLQAHPQIWMPKEKELHYFDEKVNQEGRVFSRVTGKRLADKRWRRQFGSRFKGFPRRLALQDLAWDLKYFFGQPNDEWYASLFEPGRGRITGEETPDYATLDKDMVARIRELMPDAKIIFMMRSPIERPWSAVDMRFRTKGLSLEETKDRKLYRRFDNKGSRLRTDYLRTLENWGSFYPGEQIFVGFLEDINFFPGELLRSLYEFLGVDPSVEYQVISRKVHSGQQETIPTRFAVYLARAYHENLKKLHGCFGGYASFWLYCAERLINDPPSEEHVPYPLWESAMWNEWEGSGKIAMRSGPLSSVRATS